MRWILVALFFLAPGCNLATNRQNLDGRRSFEVGQYDRALQSFHLALNADPSNADAHYNIGRTLHHMGKAAKNQQHLQQAENAYRTALNLNPLHQPAHRGLAVLMSENKRTPEAFSLLQNWSRINPASAEPKIELARLYTEHGDKKTAIQILSDALVIDNENDRALRALGLLREEAGDFRQAVTDYQRSLQINPMQPQLANRLAQLQLRTGVPSPSVVAPNRVATLPDFPRFQ